MQFRIGCVDGITYESDILSDDKIMDELNSKNGVIGTKPGGQAVHVNSVDEVYEFMNNFMNEILEDGSGIVSIDMSGQYRVFPARNVVWFELVR